jgi:hypothetical protein
MKLDELAQREADHVMVFGRSKSGKSTLVSKLALTHKLIWLSLDRGHGVLYKLPPEARNNIDIIVLPDTHDFPVAMDTIRKLISGNPTTLCHAHSLVGCSVCANNKQPTTSYEFKKLSSDTIVVIDHVTQLTDSCMALICKKQPVDYKPKLDDWGSLRFFMMQIMGEIQQAPYNIVCIAQEMEAEMEDGSKLLCPAVGSREFGKSVGSFFDHIVYCRVQNLSHKAGSATTYSASILTGSRRDIAIETQKEGASLLPFFDGTTERAKKRGAEQVEEVGRMVAGTPAVGFAEPAVPKVELEGTVSMTQPKEVEALPLPSQPGAGNVTSMHTGSPAMSAAEAMLAKMRGAKK